MSHKKFRLSELERTGCSCDPLLEERCLCSQQADERRTGNSWVLSRQIVKVPETSCLSHSGSCRHEFQSGRVESVMCWCWFGCGKEARLIEENGSADIFEGVFSTGSWNKEYIRKSLWRRRDLSWWPHPYSYFACGECRNDVGYESWIPGT